MTESVTVEHLSKSYKLGALRQETQLRDQLVRLLRQPFRRRAPTQILWALRDVSFTVQEGEVVGIIGRNGAGKSTLLKVLSKITHPTSGRVRARGRVAALLEVGAGFHEELTGRENIFLNGSVMGMKKKEVDAKLEAIVEFSGLARFLDTPIKRYSSGMRSRLGFAVAAHLDPDVLIVDEVLAVGDAAFQKKCVRAMQDLRSGGRTVLFVSHNMAAVENLCSRGIWISDGSVRLDGPTHAVIEAYMATFASAGAGANEFAAVEGRRGSGEIRYTRVEYLSEHGELQPVIRAGKRIVFRLHYRANETIERATFAFNISTELGTLVTEFSTWLHGLDLPQIPAGTGYVDLEVDALNLLPGRYQLSLWINAGGNPRAADSLENALQLDVEETPIYGSSRLIDNRYGSVFFPQRWHFGGIGSGVAADVSSAVKRSKA
jgi:lipopolysaccharide transport system ATP-binding protein